MLGFTPLEDLVWGRAEALPRETQASAKRRIKNRARFLQRSHVVATPLPSRNWRRKGNTKT